MTVQELMELDKGVKITEVTGVLSKIGAGKTTATGKIRQTAMLEDNTGEMQVTVWGGKIDKFLFGSIFTIKEGYIDEYAGAKRITVNKNADIVLVTKKGSTAKDTTVKKETPAPANLQPANLPKPEATTGAVAPQTVPVASTDREECKNIMQECIEDALALIGSKGFCLENAVSIINTLYIERCKRVRKDRF